MDYKRKINIIMTNQNHTILVIEDDLPVQEAVQMKLIKAGFRVLVTTSAEDGMLILASSKPDFIWLDMLLPGMTGLQFLEFLRSHELYREVPVMIVSAFDNPDKVKKAFELNVVNYMTKIDHPIKDIVDEVSSYFENKDSK